MINKLCSKRGRPKSVAKRQDILAASAHLFLAGGYSRTSMDKVAKQAGVSKQTLYSHFKNKHELFRACITSKVEEYHLDLSVTASDSGIRDNLFMLGCNLFDLYHDESVIALYRVLMSESTNHPGLCELFYEAGPLATKQGLASYLQKSASMYFKNEDEAIDAAEIYIGSIETSIWRRTMLGIDCGIARKDRNGYVESRVNWFMRSMEPGQISLI